MEVETRRARPRLDVGADLRRQRDDERMIGLGRGADRPGRAEPVQDRHVQVEKDDVGRETPGLLQPLCAVERHVGLVPAGREQHREQFRGVDGVVHHQDIGH